jgi:mono/diheme cytochrome c family protein
VRIAAAVAFVVACSNATPAPTARATFSTRCVPCHGESGRGDGPLAAKAHLKLPDFTDAAWQTHATDDELRKAIVLGGPAVGKGSGMPAVPDLEGTPQLDELVTMVRGFAH